MVVWRAWLVYTHRWLGIAGCAFFVAWFASGIVMMYVRMPSLAPEERLARAVALDLSTATISPSEAAKRAGASMDGVRVTMLRGRPIYRFSRSSRESDSAGTTRGAQAIFADTGERLQATGIGAARVAALAFEPAYTGPVHDDGFLTAPDQWTLQARAALPMFRFALDDAAATGLYVSAATGEVVLRTTRRERFWAYLGPVVHWIYFTPLRRNGPLWSEIVIWSSLAGCLLCASGLVWGAIRFSPRSRCRLKRTPSHTPYSRWMKWHHYIGLGFGLVTLTWVYSGLLSMEPFGWFRPVGSVGPVPHVQSEPSADVTLDALRAAHTTFTSSFAPKTLTLTMVNGEWYWMAERAPARSEADRWRGPSLLPRSHRERLARAYVPMSEPQRGLFHRFPVATLHAVARAVMGDTRVEEVSWIDRHDAYYYDARGAAPLPVLRIRYADAQATWLHLDPTTGTVAQRLERSTRTRRWLYQGLHSLDVPFLYDRRPLWDIVVILLSLGGVGVSVSPMVPAWRRLARHGSRWRRRARNYPARRS